jgi:hypothetical protein
MKYVIGEYITKKIYSLASIKLAVQMAVRIVVLMIYCAAVVGKLLIR